MKKAFVIFTLIVTVASCKKDENENNGYKCTTCAQTPAALAANDNSSKGIYKGVLLASSGTIEFDISNSNSTVTAVMVIDGITVNLTSNVAWVGGQSYIAPFTGTLNGDPLSITFSVNADGSNPTVSTSDIPGHPNAVFTIVKETSNNLVECFEGEFTEGAPDNSHGTFNVVLSRSLQQWTGSYKKDGAADTYPVGGTINSASQMINDANGANMATLSGDELSGQFSNATPSIVTVSGQRTW